MKKILTLFASLALLLSLTACSLVTRPADDDLVDPAYYGEGTGIIFQENIIETGTASPELTGINYTGIIDTLFSGIIDNDGLDFVSGDLVE